MRRRSLLQGMMILAGIKPLRAMAPVRLAYPDNTDDPLWANDGLFRQLLIDVIVRGADIPIICEPLPWLRALRVVADGEADALFCPTNILLSQSILFAALPLIGLRSSWLVRRDDERFTAIAPKCVPGLVRLDVHGSEMPILSLMSGTRSTFAPDLRAQVAMIAAGRADIAPILELRGRYLIRRLGLGDQLKLLPADERFFFHFGIRRDHPDATFLVTKVNEAIKRSTVYGSPISSRLSMIGHSSSTARRKSTTNQ